MNGALQISDNDSTFPLSRAASAQLSSAQQVLEQFGDEES